MTQFHTHLLLVVLWKPAIWLDDSTFGPQEIWGDLRQRVHSRFWRPSSEQKRASNRATITQHAVQSFPQCAIYQMTIAFSIYVHFYDIVCVCVCLSHCVNVCLCVNVCVSARSSKCKMNDSLCVGVFVWEWLCVLMYVQVLMCVSVW